MGLFSVINMTGIDIERLFEINYLKCLGGFCRATLLSVCLDFMVATKNNACDG